jgi:RNA binding exosome subunit
MNNETRTQEQSAASGRNPDRETAMEELQDAVDGNSGAYLTVDEAAALLEYVRYLETAQ